MQHALSQFLRAEFRPPNYLALPTAGVDISASGIKVVCLTERAHGLELYAASDVELPSGVISGGEIADRPKVVAALRELSKRHHFKRANIALPEARGYLFEALVPDAPRGEQRTAIEPHLEEYVPLPSNDVSFDFAPLSSEGGQVRAVGVGYAHRVVEESVRALEEAGIEVRSAESETFALPRAILPSGSKETVLIVDIGKSTTKLLVASGRLPRFVTTLDIGGHALTLAIGKYFGATEEEARKIKIEHGIASDAGNEDYLAAMLSTVSVIRDEIVRRFQYWQSHTDASHDPISRVLLVGGNSSVRGISEYLADSLKVPVSQGNVFQNLAPEHVGHAPLDPTAALAYGTAIGLALRDYEH